MTACFCGMDGEATCQGCGKRLCRDHAIPHRTLPKNHWEWVDHIAKAQGEPPHLERRLLGHALHVLGGRGFALGHGVRCGYCRAADSLEALRSAPEEPSFANPMELFMWRYETFDWRQFKTGMGAGWQRCLLDLAKRRGWPFEEDPGFGSCLTFTYVDAHPVEGESFGKVFQVYEKGSVEVRQQKIQRPLRRDAFEDVVTWTDHAPLDAASWDTTGRSVNDRAATVTFPFEDDPFFDTIDRWNRQKGRVTTGLVLHELVQYRQYQDYPGFQYLVPGDWASAPPEGQWQIIEGAAAEATPGPDRQSP